ncbi:MAG: MFS transporter [Candidatus Eremiobacteraeota bacterium]|nr:MFS transporter [Candidatus Eremiobacteraeota bacterium]
MPLRLAAVVTLVGIAIFINYIDRGNLSTAATLVQTEFHLTPSRLGFLLTAFFITYMPMQPVAGALIDRFSASRVLVIGFVVWSLATTLSGLAGGFAALFACRLLLGLGESVSFPSISKIFAENLEEAQRGLANGITMAGVAVGPAFGVFLGGNLIAAYGWRPFFVVTGLVSLLWLVAWSIVVRKGMRPIDRVPSTDAPALRLILREPSLWGASLGAFCNVFVLYFLVTWIPYYLVHQRHWSLPQMASIAGTAFLLGGIACVACGAISDYCIRRGASPTLVRKAGFVIGGAGTATGLLGCGYSSGLASEAWLMLAGFAVGMFHANNFAVGQTMAGPLAAGRWAGIQNTVANVSGLIAPWLTGILVEKTGSFTSAFTIAAAMALCSPIAWVFLVGPIARIDWSLRLAQKTAFSAQTR